MEYVAGVLALGLTGIIIYTTDALIRKLEKRVDASFDRLRMDLNDIRSEHTHTVHHSISRLEELIPRAYEIDNALRERLDSIESGLQKRFDVIEREVAELAGEANGIALDVTGLIAKVDSRSGS